MAGLSVLEQNLATLTAEEREEMARSLERLGHRPEVQPFVRRLLRDPAADVRVQAVSTLLQGARRAEPVTAVLDELGRPQPVLMPWDVLRGYSRQDPSGAAATALRQWCLRTLGSSTNASVHTLALIYLGAGWKRGDESVVLPFTKTADPWRRRAAWRLLADHARPVLLERLGEVTGDSSEFVRAVVPALFLRGWRHPWIHYLDTEHFQESYGSYSSSDAPRPSDAAREALRSLTRDPVPRVRLEAFFVLLAARQSVDLTAFVRTLTEFGDQEAVSERVAEFLNENYQKLGREFAILLPYANAAGQDEEEMAKLYRHFGGEADALSNLVYLARQESLPATFDDSGVVAAQPWRPTPQRVVFFVKSGCSDCERVRGYLRRLRESFGELQVEELDVAKVAALRRNEALAERFGVPAERRLVAPAVFAGAGALVRDEITFGRLGKLLQESAGVPAEDWYEVPETELASTDAAIRGRFAGFRLAFVAWGGLLDGINPCAFATLIFFVSYMQVTRRRPREIAQIGAAFIAGVFLAYLLLGIGLSELLGRLLLFRVAGQVLNAAMALLVLVLMVLSVRDGVRCAKGRMQDMTLQLPGVLKRKAHEVIRGGARQRRFVAAAFLTGGAIALLELACTGQIYAPIILYVLKSGGSSWSSFLYLLWYNLFFILPLVAVFALVYSGLRNDALLRFMERHAAAVKFATAALFAVFLVVLLARF
jgi:cytochrome c biogenesis protein CcdA